MKKITWMKFLFALCISCLVSSPVSLVAQQNPVGEEASAILSNPSPGVETSITFSFPIPAGITWPATGGVDFTFPAGFTLTNVGPADVGDVIGNVGPMIAPLVSGQTVFTRRNSGGSGGTSLTDEYVKIQIDDVGAPTTLGMTDEFLITLRMGPGGAVQKVFNVPGVVISEALTLGGGSNKSSFCMANRDKAENFMPWYVMLSLILVGVFVSKTLASERSPK